MDQLGLLMRRTLIAIFLLTASLAGAIDFRLGGNLYRRVSMVAGGTPPVTNWVQTITPLHLLDLETTNALGVTDVSGNGYDARLMPAPVGGPTRLAGSYTNMNGRSETVYYFNGADDAVQGWTNDASLDIHSNFSQTVWINPSNFVDFADIVSKYNATAGKRGVEWQFSGTLGLMNCTINGTSGLYETDWTIPSNTWTHLALVYNFDSTNIYIDDLSGSGNSGQMIGNDGGNRMLDGWTKSSRNSTPGAYDKNYFATWNSTLVCGPTNLLQGATSCTLACWVKMDTRINYGGLLFSRGTHVNGLCLANTPNEMFFYINSVAISNVTPLETGVWSYVVGTWVSNASWTIYLNGTQDCVNTISATNIVQNDSFKLGWDDGADARQLDGQFDDVVIAKNYAWSSNEQLTAFQTGVYPTNGMVVWYDFAKPTLQRPLSLYVNGAMAYGSCYTGVVNLSNTVPWKLGYYRKGCKYLADDWNMFATNIPESEISNLYLYTNPTNNVRQR